MQSKNLKNQDEKLLSDQNDNELFSKIIKKENKITCAVI